jgi:protein TonB
MKAKKNKKVDIERYRALFFRIGLSFSILFVVFAFRWTTENEIGHEIWGDPDEYEEEFMPRTFQEEPKQEKPEMVELNVVDKEPLIDLNTRDLFVVDVNPSDEIPVVPIKTFDPVEIDDGPHDFHQIERKPSFPGGEKAMFHYLKNNLNYPELEKEIGLQGLVTLFFIVNADGSISDVEVIKGVSPNIDAEAARVVSEMPDWIPGRQRDKNVSVFIKMPIRFSLAY